MKFACGNIVATPTLLAQVPAEEYTEAVCSRHIRGDWGDVNELDQEVNEESLRDNNGILFSIYHSKDGVKFWVITEADRSKTTICMPNEYEKTI